MSIMNIIEQYASLSKAGRWGEALPVIQEIIERSPQIDTSWFNYGVCLDELERHQEAADAFIRAHELNVTDSGIHYRVFRSLYLAEDFAQLREFGDYICQTFPEERELIFSSDEYVALRGRDEFRQLEEQYANK